MSVHLVEHDGRTYPLGRLNDTPHDPRNREYPARTSTGPLKRVEWTRTGGPFDQGNTGSCTGNALAGVLNTAPLYSGGPLRTEADARAFYSAGTKVDNIRGVWPPTDTGSTGPAVCKAALKAGVIGGYDHAFGIDHMLAALQLGPVMLGTVWLKGMFTPSAAGVVTPSGSIAGGHEYEAYGYDPATDLVAFWNSWGTSWSVGGKFFMHVRDVTSLLNQQGDVTVPRLVG